MNTKQAGTYLLAVKVTYPDKSWEVTRFVKVTVKVRPGHVTLGQKLSIILLTHPATPLSY
ncbi:hypothetical protein [Lactobacillus delbrueckii]|uniref:hypothetical protein n=1 Tax=Lactobacillus delbrueckii TaxID=1584 RepID=UPI0035715C84